MLKTLTESHKINWKDHIKKLTFTYNNRKTKTTGYSHRLFYLVKQSLPTDQVFESSSDIDNTKQNYFFAKDWQGSMKTLYFKL